MNGWGISRLLGLAIPVASTHNSCGRGHDAVTRGKSASRGSRESDQRRWHEACEECAEAGSGSESMHWLRSPPFRLELRTVQPIYSVHMQYCNEALDLESCMFIVFVRVKHIHALHISSTHSGWFTSRMSKLDISFLFRSALCHPSTHRTCIQNGSCKYQGFTQLMLIPSVNAMHSQSAANM